MATIAAFDSSRKCAAALLDSCAPLLRLLSHQPYALILRVGGVKQALHPQECPLLQSGARFEGKQSVSRAGVRDDDWTIALTVDQCEWDRGYLCGIMTASETHVWHLPN
jgi:hypothetical protein